MIISNPQAEFYQSVPHHPCLPPQSSDFLVVVCLSVYCNLSDDDLDNHDVGCLSVDCLGDDRIYADNPVGNHVGNPAGSHGDNPEKLLLSQIHGLAESNLDPFHDRGSSFS